MGRGRSEQESLELGRLELERSELGRLELGRRDLPAGDFGGSPRREDRERSQVGNEIPVVPRAGFGRKFAEGRRHER